MKLDKRSFLAAAALAALALFSVPAAAASMIGNCEVSGEKGSIPITSPAKARQFTVEVSLPAPIWWNGDTPESIKDGMEYCLAAEIAWRAGYDKFELINVGWDPLVTGQTPQSERDRLYDRFRDGLVRHLILSRVGNFALDLPDANVLVQVSGTFGSRQEEAQRLGRILRPKSDGGLAYFYSIVTRDSRDQEFSANRQLFLTEQGYRYVIEDAEALLA